MRWFILSVSLALFLLAAPSGAQESGDKKSPVSCCSNIDKKPLRQLNSAETLEWLTCNEIAPNSIDIVKREKVVGYELALMSQEELMELLSMTKIHAWRVSRCKDVTDGTRRWGAQGQAAGAPKSGGASKRGPRCRFQEDMTGRRCFGLERAPDPAWTPASCKDQCCKNSETCGVWLYSYAEGCWFGPDQANLNCKDEAGWFGGRSPVASS